MVVVTLNVNTFYGPSSNLQKKIHVTHFLLVVRVRTYVTCQSNIEISGQNSYNHLSIATCNTFHSCNKSRGRVTIKFSINEVFPMQNWLSGWTLLIQDVLLSYFGFYDIATIIMICPLQPSSWKTQSACLFGEKKNVNALVVATDKLL